MTLTGGRVTTNSSTPRVSDPTHTGEGIMTKTDDSVQKTELLNGSRMNQKKTQRPAVFRSLFHEIMCVIILTFAPALNSVTVGGLTIALTAIGKEFNIDGGVLSWTQSAAALGTASFLLVMGQISDVLGRKRMLTFAYIMFVIFSIIAGFMKSVIPFFIFRALQGVCSATAVTAGAGILGATYKNSRRKNYAMASFGAGAPIGFIAGIVSSGICLEILGWNAVLFFYAIVYAILTVLALLFVPNDPPLERSRIMQKFRTLDYGGGALAVSGLTLFVFSLSQADAAPEGWNTPYMIALLIVGVVLMISFCFYEAYVPNNPLMPMRIWKFPGFALSMGIISCGWVDFTGCLNYYATLYFQDVKGASPILTTAYYVPQAVAGILVNAFAGYTLHRIPGRILIIIAMAGFTGAALLWSFVEPNTLYWALPFPAFILVVIGADLAYNVCNMHALSSVDRSLQSSAAATFNTVLQISTAVGLAASSAIVNSVTPNQDTATPEQLVKGYHAGYYFALAVAALGLVMSFFLNVGTKGAETKSDQEDQAKGEKETNDPTTSSVPGIEVDDDLRAESGDMKDQR